MKLLGKSLKNSVGSKSVYLQYVKVYRFVFAPFNFKYMPYQKTPSISPKKSYIAAPPPLPGQSQNLQPQPPV